MDCSVRLVDFEEPTSFVSTASPIGCIRLTWLGFRGYKYQNQQAFFNPIRKLSGVLVLMFLPSSCIHPN